MKHILLEGVVEFLISKNLIFSKKQMKEGENINF